MKVLLMIIIAFMAQNITSNHSLFKDLKRMFEKEEISDGFKKELKRKLRKLYLPPMPTREDIRRFNNDINMITKGTEQNNTDFSGKNKN